MIENNRKKGTDMHFFYFKFLLMMAAVIIFFSCQQQQKIEEKTSGYNTFKFEFEITLPGSPEVIYDAITGDISGWWDHKFSENPARFFIEAKPGGGFWEYFDEKGENGVLHARVIYADRGKFLRMDGPLGLSGQAIQMVHTYSLTKVKPDSTQLKLSVHAAGEMDDSIAPIVEKVWRHFIIDQFKPYVEAGKHLK